MEADRRTFLIGSLSAALAPFMKIPSFEEQTKGFVKPDLSYEAILRAFLEAYEKAVGSRPEPFSADMVFVELLARNTYDQLIWQQKLFESFVPMTSASKEHLNEAMGLT